MVPYLIVAIALFILALAGEGRQNFTKIGGVAAAALLVLFAGLRFETGYDWPEYVSYFNATPDIAGLFGGSSFPSFADPLYVALNTAARSLGWNVYVVFFVVALIGIGVTHLVVGRIATNTAAIWAVYFGIVFTTAHMMLLRQALASAFVLLALLWAVERKSFRAPAAGMVAAGFHITAALFAPLLLLWRIRPAFWFSASVVLGGFGVAIAQVNLVSLVGDAVLPFAPDLLVYRVAYYSALAPAPITVGSAALIAFHIAVLVGLSWRSRESAQREDDAFVNVALWLTLLVLSAHLFLWSFPNIWNRAMLVSIPWQLATIWRVWPSLRKPQLSRPVAFLGLFAFSISALIYSLAKPAALPFVPYQSIVLVMLTGDCGDGFERLVAAEATNNEFTTPQVGLPSAAVALENNRMAELFPAPLDERAPPPIAGRSCL